jgi:ketosteroid isomerase-like protein
MQRPVTLTSLLLASTFVVVNCSSPTTPDGSGLHGGSSAASLTRVSRAEENPAALRATEEVARLDAAEVQAFLADDPETLARLWSDDFVVTNPFNQFVNKQQVLALVTSGVLAFAAYERHTEYAHAYGDVVVVAGSETVVWAGKIPLAGQTTRLRYTAVWARHGNEWQEVARHANIVLPGGPPGPASTR